MHRNSGFSIYELMVVIAIIGILAAIFIPNMIGWRDRAKLGEGTRDLYAAFQLARSRAARENVDVTLSFAPAGALGQRYALFVDDGAGTADADLDGVPDGAGDGLINGTETVFMNGTLPPGVRVNATTFTNDAVAFGGNGLPNGVGSANLANTRGDTRSLFLSIAGRVRVQY